MSEEEREIFNFDINTIDWERYISSFCMGTKKYLLKDNISNLANARQQIRRYFDNNYIVRLSVVTTLFTHCISFFL